MLDAVRDAIEHYRDNPWELLKDVLGAAAITLLTVGMMYLPLFLE